jgi:hypothetical protein
MSKELENVDNGAAAAIQKVVDLAHAAMSVEDVTPSGGSPGGQFLLRYPDGTVRPFIAPPKWHDERFWMPRHLADFAAHKLNKPDTAIFVGANAVVAVYNLEDRRDQAVCTLSPSPAYKFLSGPCQAMDQASFIRTLRFHLKGCSGVDDLLKAVRAVRFTASGETTGEVSNARNSMGRQIIAEASGVTALAEDISLGVQLFENFPYPVTIPCGTEVDPTAQTFRIQPYPLALRRALDQTLEMIGEDVGTSGLPVFYGNP